MSRSAPRIKNRAPAPIQISAEQLLREAQERQEAPASAPVQKIEDYEELEEYRGRRRSEFEDRLRRNGLNMSTWIKYASWEASQGEMDRCRSIYERALDVEPHHLPLWLRYTEQELKMRNVQHARNLYDRAVSILPRIDQLWYKYVHLEELLGNIPGTRQVFERWMKWEPEEKAWHAYINLEVRYDELDRASAIWERCVTCHPVPKQWIRWAKFEEDRGNLEKARIVFQMALDYIGEDEDAMEKAQSVFTAFAKMETRLKEYERARVIYKYALERLPRSKSEGIYSSYTRFEKQFGTMNSVEDTVIGKRRIQYEEELAAQEAGGAPADYDTWFDYSRLEEDAYRALLATGGSQDQLQQAVKRVREVYERAIAQVPSSQEKRDWRRYIFLWLRYALFEEIDTRDYDRTREIYKAAIALVPHRRFTFAKLWVQYARFEVRRLELTAARKILGAAIGMAPKLKLFSSYIELEVSLKEFDRARKIYEKALEWDPTNSQTWVRFAELEKNLFDTDRARALFELGVGQAEGGEASGGLDMPEIVWKAYIDFEFEEREWEKVDALYERLLTKSGHVKVWISYALSKINRATAIEEDEDEEDDDHDHDDDMAATPSRELTEEEEALRQQRRSALASSAREIFQRAYDNLKSRSLKDERVALLESWKSFEQQHGSAETLSRVEAKFPRVVKKRRQVEDSADGAMEEYYDLIFPDDQDEGKGAFKLLQMAHAWRAAQAAKEQQQQQQQQSSSAETGASASAGAGATGDDVRDEESIGIAIDDDQEQDASGEEA